MVGLVGLIWLCSKVLGYLQPVLIPIAISGIVAYLLDPFVSWLQKKGLTRLKSVITVFTSFVIAIGVMIFLVVPPIVSQAKDLFTAKTDSGESQLSQNITKTINELGETPWIKPTADWALSKYEDSGTSVSSDSLSQPTDRKIPYH